MVKNCTLLVDWIAAYVWMKSPNMEGNVYLQKYPAMCGLELKQNRRLSAGEPVAGKKPDHR